METFEGIVRRIVREELERALGARELTEPAALASGDLMSPDDVSALLGVSRGHLANWRSNGLGPRYVKVGRLVRYRRPDIDDWIVRAPVVWLTVREMSERARRHSVTVRKALEAGELHGSQPNAGATWRARPECVDAWIDGRPCSHR